MRWSVPALAVLSAALAGCGGDDARLRTVTVEGSKPIRVGGDEYAYDPGRIVVRGAPEKLAITLVNTGSLAHDIAVLDGDRRLGKLRSFPAGEERTLEVRVPPGRYRLVCTVADHEELGMTGELEVRR